MIKGQEKRVNWVFGEKDTNQPEEAKTVTQVHGKRVIIVKNKEEITHDEEADALVTNISGVTLAVKTADCIPLLLYDAKAGVIGAVHAGWRGANAGIIEAGLEAMRSLGANDIKALLGPSIQRDSYEVTEEFLDFFPEDFFTEKEGCLFFDLPLFAKNSLLKAGVKEIWESGIDTYQSQGFFSHRRAHKEGKPPFIKGRNWSWISCDLYNHQ